MVRLLLVFLLLSAPAAAADRTIGVGSFDRLRVDGPFDVRIATGGSPRASLSGEADTIDQVDLQVNGTTMTIRRRSGTIGRARNAPPVIVTLSTPRLVSAAVIGSGSLQVKGLRADRADLSVAGTGTIAVEGLAAEQASALLVGNGRITLGGRATHLRLSTNGPGAIDAAKVVAEDLVVRLDGPGQTTAQARYVANVTSTGLGTVEISGKPKCTVRAPSGTVLCGE